MSNKIYVIGDLHGSYHPIKHFYEKYKDSPGFNFDGTDTIILLGDAGLNYYLDHRDDNFKNALCKYPFTYFVIRGNHEERASNLAQNNPDWQFENFWGGIVLVEKEFPNIKYAMDYPAFYNIPYIGNHEHDLTYIWRTLVIPGAYSVDKEYRHHNIGTELLKVIETNEVQTVGYGLDEYSEKAKSKNCCGRGKNGVYGVTGYKHKNHSFG